jgi:hypothetical protein
MMQNIDEEVEEKYIKHRKFRILIVGVNLVLLGLILPGLIKFTEIVFKNNMFYNLDKDGNEYDTVTSNCTDCKAQCIKMSGENVMKFTGSWFTWLQWGVWLNIALSIFNTAIIIWFGTPKMGETDATFSVIGGIASMLNIGVSSAVQHFIFGPMCGIDTDSIDQKLKSKALISLQKISTEAEKAKSALEIAEKNNKKADEVLTGAINNLNSATTSEKIKIAQVNKTNAEAEKITAQEIYDTALQAHTDIQNELVNAENYYKSFANVEMYTTRYNSDICFNKQFKWQGLFLKSIVIIWCVLLALSVISTFVVVWPPSSSSVNKEKSFMKKVALG